MLSLETNDIEYGYLDDSDALWEPTVRPLLLTSVGFSRDLAVDVEDVGSDLLDRATETPPHVHLIGALRWFSS